MLCLYLEHFLVLMVHGAQKWGDMKVVKYLLMHFIRSLCVYSMFYGGIYFNCCFLCDFCQIVSALRFQSIILNLNGFIQVMNGTGFPVRFDTTDKAVEV